MNGDTTPGSTLATVLDPGSVAIIGASDNPERIGGRPVYLLGLYGFAGSVYPINPNRTEVQGLTSYPDLAALPEVPDVAVIAVAGTAAEEAVTDCAQAGVKVAIVIASGFGEASEEGLAAQQRMVATARATGMRMVGPNCYGLANIATGTVLTFSTVLRDSPPIKGPVAVVSQSGSMSIVPCVLLHQVGIGIRGLYGTGNDADVTVSEVAVEVARDPGVELLLLYLETVRDAAPLAELASVARQRNLPVVALKAGRTSAGQNAARSHTGALANEDRLVDAFFEQHGIYRAHDTEDLVRAAQFHLTASKPHGRRLVAISNSGASCVQIADAATDRGLPLSQLAPTTLDGLAAALPGFATSTNPIDITAALLNNSGLFSEVLPLIAEDPTADAVVIALQALGRGYDLERFVGDSGAFARQTGKPVVIATCQPDLMTSFREEGLPAFATEVAALDALTQYLVHGELLESARQREPRVIAPRLGAATALLDEASSLRLVADAGVPVVAHRLCPDEETAVDAFHALGGPVVLKGCSAHAPHKTELGLVRLGLDSVEAVRTAAKVVLASVRALDADAPGLIVARMAGGWEMMIGAKMDAVFGPVVLIGAGGTDVELEEDVQTLLPPFDGDAVHAAVGRLRIAPRLAGFRGSAPADVASFVDAVMAVQRMVLDPGVAIASLDLNPVFVGPEGMGCAVADAVMERFV